MIESAIEKYRDSIRRLEAAAEDIQEARELASKELESAKKEAAANTFTQQEAAAVLGCSRMTIHRKLNHEDPEQRLKSLKIDDVLQYKRNHKIG